MTKRLLIADHFHDYACACLIENGKLSDLFFDAPAKTHSDNIPPRPQAIYFAKVLRHLTNINASYYDLGHNHKGFLKNSKSKPQAQILQATSFAQENKATPLTDNVAISSHYVVILPNDSGYSLSKNLKADKVFQSWLNDQSANLHPLTQDCGVIFRTQCQDHNFTAIHQDLIATHTKAQSIKTQAKSHQTQNKAGLLLPPPSAFERARLIWSDDDITPIHYAGCFRDYQIDEMIQALQNPKIALPQGGNMIIETTAACVTIDINTAQDTSAHAGFKASIHAIKALAPSLRVLGLGGQIVIDFPPFPKRDRALIEKALTSTFSHDYIKTQLMGWTPLGHFELLRKRDRMPVSDLIAQVLAKPAQQQR